MLRAWCGVGLVVCGVLLAASGARGDDRGPRKVALLVGVDKYLKPGFKDLQFAEADVQAMAVELKKLGFDVRVLLGSASGTQQATLANIDAAAREMVTPLGKDDLALVMLSGHGQTLKRRAEANDLDESFYCPVDAIRIPVGQSATARLIPVSTNRAIP